MFKQTNFGHAPRKLPQFTSHIMVIQVSADLYLHHTCLPLLMQVLGPWPIRNIIFILNIQLSTSSTAPHAILWTIVRKTEHFLYMYLAYNCLWTCTHITCSQFRPPQFTHNSPDLCPRATLVCVPLSNRLVCLYHDLSRACIGMFKSHLLHPYYTDEVWTIFHHPKMGHLLCHSNRLTILEFLLRSFLTPKRMKILLSTAASFLAR